MPKETPEEMRPIEIGDLFFATQLLRSAIRLFDQSHRKFNEGVNAT
jgi:hypothetical protein